MLTVFYGTDRDSINAAAKKRLADFVAENPGAEVFALDADNFSAAELERHVGSVGLFTSKHAVIVSHVLTHAEHGEALVERLPSLAESENLFVLKEAKLLAKEKKTIAKYADETEEFSGEKKLEKKVFPIFDLADALGRRDKKTLWIGYQKALRDGIAPDDVLNILMWQVRMMLRASAGAMGDMKPFVADKARRYVGNYPGGGVRELSMTLLSIYHDTRRGKVDLGRELERVILTL